MTGEELYKKLTGPEFLSKEMVGTPEYNYARILIGFHHYAFLNLEEDKFFHLLLTAHKEGKKLSAPDYGSEILIDDYKVSDIVLV